MNKPYNWEARRLFAFFMFTLGILVSVPSWGQVNIVLKKVPANTPPRDTIYITGSFNDWDPSDKDYMLTLNAQGEYAIKLPPEVQIFEYKFTRGNWLTVETDDEGNLVPNRLYNGDDDLMIEVSIQGWEDMFSDALAYTRFVVTELPDNTPYGADIYITGSFNHWNPQDPTCKLTKGADGNYQVDLPSSVDSLEYKFTRGSWQTVEGKRNGKFRENRFFARASNKSETVSIQIESWEDIVGNMPRFTVLLLLFSGFAGVFVTFAVYNMPSARRKQRNYLTALLALQAISTVIWVVFAEFKDPYRLYPKMFIVPDFIFFIFPPLFYGYVLMMTGSRLRFTKWHGLLALPILIHLLTYLPLFYIEHSTFNTQLINDQYTTIFGWIGLAGLLYSAVFFVLSLQCFFSWSQRQAAEQSMIHPDKLIPIQGRFNFIRALMVNYGLVLVVWLFTAVSFLSYHYFSFETDLFVDYGTETTWGCFALFPFVTAFYHITRPELFSVKNFKDSQTTGQFISPEEMQKYKGKLDVLMNKEQVYLNPKINLNDLAKTLGVSSYMLSRVINQGYGKNFYDYVNGYRVKAFKESSDKLKDGSENILSLAYKVGFNSKTAFNRAFKKITGKTPSEEMKEVS